MQWTVETWWRWIRQGSRGHLLTERSSGHMLLSAWWLMGQLWAQAPIWSLHASFMELSEVIFQNWLHLRTCWGAHFLGVANEGVASGAGGVCFGEGGALQRFSGRYRVPPAGPIAPQSWPSQLWRSPLSFPRWHLLQTLPPVFRKMLPETPWPFSLGCLWLQE